MSMTSARNNISQYKQVDNYTGVNDANPHQLVAMLLDGALGKLAAVKGYMTHGEVVKKGETIGQAISIVGGLRASLDMEAGGEVAINLNNLYDYIERRLLEANLKNDVAMVDEASKLLREIKTAWDAIPHEARNASKPTVAAAG